MKRDCHAHAGRRRETAIAVRDDVPEMEGDAAGPAFVEIDAQGRYVDGNQGALAVYGVTLEELTRHRVGDFSRPGMGTIQRALFLWLIRQDRDFGGGESTVVSADGRQTRIRCTSICRVGDRYRVTFRTVAGAPVPPHSENLPAVLEAWREAEREASAATSEPERELAGTASASLRDIYQYVSERKS